MPLGDKGKTTIPVKGMRAAVQQAADELLGIEREIRALKAEHEEVLKKHYGPKAWEKRLKRGEELRDAREAAEEKVKVEARKLAVIGDTTVLVEAEDVHVSVVGTRPTIGYDLEVAEKLWPKAIIKAALVKVIDPKVVQAMIDKNQLTGETLEAIRKARRESPNTAKVSVRTP